MSTQERHFAVINTNNHTPLENKVFVAATGENFANAPLTEEANKNLSQRKLSLKTSKF